MYNLENVFQRQKKILVLLICLFAILSVVTPFKFEFRGLFIGTIASLFNLWISIHKIIGFKKMVVDDGEQVYSVGFLERVISTAIAVGLAFLFPEFLSLYFVITGLVMMHILIVIDFVIFMIFRKQRKRGE
ncbi:MAG: synthase subunit [Bacillales bacterium]|jgi:ATP synthase protein I|nr:synthase subunit [Bacillales bacterium]